MTISSLDEATKSEIHSHIIQNLKGKRKLHLGSKSLFVFFLYLCESGKFSHEMTTIGKIHNTVILAMERLRLY